jgi:DNA-directed RNA polymerases I and III subunit RPAC2
MVCHPANEASSIPIIGFTDKLSSLGALINALSNLDSLCQSVEGAYRHSLENDNIEYWDEKS